MLSHICGSWYFTQVPVQRRVIYHYNHGFFGISGSSLGSVYDVKAVWAYWVDCGATVLMDGRGSLDVFFNPVSKSSPRFTNVCLWAVDVGTFEMVDDSTLL